MMPDEECAEYVSGKVFVHLHLQDIYTEKNIKACANDCNKTMASYLNKDPRNIPKNYISQNKELVL